MEKARINIMLLNWNWNCQYGLMFSFIYGSLKKKKDGAMWKGHRNRPQRTLDGQELELHHK